MRTAYPSQADVLSYARGMGLHSEATDEAAFWAMSAAPSGAAEWERRTGYLPFLGATQDRYFDPPLDTRFVALDGGLLALTSLTVGVYAGQAGTALTQGTQFRLSPQNGPAAGRPYEIVEFLSGGYGGTAMWPYGGAWGGYGAGAGYGLGATGRAGSIKVSGVWGRQAALTEDVYRAVLSLALLTALPELATLRRQGLVSWTDDGATENYGPRPFGDLEDRLSAIVSRVLPLYTRRPLYLG